MVSTFLQPFNGATLLSSSSSHSHLHFRSATVSKWGLRREQDASILFSGRTKSQDFRVFAADPSVSPRERSTRQEIIMVDPLEAKRLAAKQTQEIKARESFKRSRRVEAINGAWAMIGLTAGLVIEGRTGKSIPTQLVDYWSAIQPFIAVDMIELWFKLKQFALDSFSKLNL